MSILGTSARGAMIAPPPVGPVSGAARPWTEMWSAGAANALAVEGAPFPGGFQSDEAYLRWSAFEPSLPSSGKVMRQVFGSFRTFRVES